MQLPENWSCMSASTVFGAKSKTCSFTKIFICVKELKKKKKKAKIFFLPSFFLFFSLSCPYFLSFRHTPLSLFLSLKKKKKLSRGAVLNPLIGQAKLKYKNEKK
ncbi:Hypothetical predicted protein [Octopus vulgaris]|uniref:Uncharacterized protein n=1 Tax=Octopus vulgaris TaxID=6645 RepID=A0AA36BKJ3_OCTVU|nr:Hypothetical predicted protein [Octopus vulgaris]